MPLYDFKCTECENVQEELASMDTTESTCDVCGKPAVKVSIYKIVAHGLPNGHIGARVPKKK